MRASLRPVQWLCHSDARQVCDLPARPVRLRVSDPTVIDRQNYERLDGKSETCCASEWQSHHNSHFHRACALESWEAVDKSLDDLNGMKTPAQRKDTSFGTVRLFVEPITGGCLYPPMNFTVVITEVEPGAAAVDPSAASPGAWQRVGLSVPQSALRPSATSFGHVKLPVRPEFSRALPQQREPRLR